MTYVCKPHLKTKPLGLDGFNKSMQVEETLRINVKPGWKKGMKFVFQEKGGNNYKQPLVLIIVKNRTVSSFVMEMI